MFYFFDDLLLLLSLFIMAIQIWFVISNIQHVYMYACTVGTESIQTPLNVSLFVILQPFAKII